MFVIKMVLGLFSFNFIDKSLFDMLYQCVNLKHFGFLILTFIQIWLKIKNVTQIVENILQSGKLVGVDSKEKKILLENNQYINVREDDRLKIAKPKICTNVTYFIASA